MTIQEKDTTELELLMMGTVGVTIQERRAVDRNNRLNKMIHTRRTVEHIRTGLITAMTTTVNHITTTPLLIRLRVTTITRTMKNSKNDTTTRHPGRRTPFTELTASERKRKK